MQSRLSPKDAAVSRVKWRCIVTIGMWTSGADCIRPVMKLMSKECVHIESERPAESNSISNTLLKAATLNK